VEAVMLLQPNGILWGILTLIFGILVLVYPRFLRYSVGIYLIIIGVWAIIPRLRF
jgi:cytochrome c biogenesis protein CcdA